MRKLALRVQNNEILFASLILIAALAFFYHDVVFKGRTFLLSPNFSVVMSGQAYGYPGPNIPRDHIVVIDPEAITQQFEPWTREIYRSLASGVLPLWSPHQGIGSPLHANAQAGIFDPLLLLVNFASDSLFPYTNDIQLLLRYFLAGLFTYLFTRAIGTRRIGSLAAAFGYMFSSYFIVYGNISLVRSDLLIPLLMYAAHKLAVKPSWGSFGLVTFAWWLIVISGFPESLPFPVMLAFLWCLLLVSNNFVKYRKLLSRERILTIARFIGAIALGTALSAFLLIPFIEFFLLSDHRGPTGDSTWRSLLDAASFVLSMLFPIQVNPLISRTYNILLLLLAFGAIAAYLRNRNAFKTYQYISYLILMTSIVAVSYILMEAVPFFRQLPLINLIYFQRHLQPLLIFCVACVAGFGVDWWLSNEISNKAIYFGTALIMIFFALILVDGRLLILESQFGGQSGLTLLLVVLGIPLSFCLLSWLTIRFKFRNTAVACLILFSILVAPLLWYQGTERPTRYDPYTPPPFVEYLQGASDGDSRILGVSILWPNTSSAYGIEDIRYLNAVFPDRYVDVAQEIVYSASELVRFNGTEPHIFYDRGINLLNVEYLVTPRRYPSAFINHLYPIESQLDNLTRRLIEFNDRLHETVNDGNSSPFNIRFRVSPSITQLGVSYGIDPQVWACACGLLGGAQFQIELYDLESLDAVPHLLLDHGLNPVENPLDRQWFSEKLDLTQWSGREIELRFYEISTEANANLEQAYWGIPTVTTEDFVFPRLEDENEIERRTILQSFGLPVSVDSIGDFRALIFQHAPSSMQAELEVPESASLEFEYALSESLWTDESIGDGVTFSVFIVDASGGQQVFERYIDPKNDASDRRWHSVTLDLAPWAGENVTLRFETGAGLAGNNDGDWAYWSNITLVAPATNKSTAVVQHIDQFEVVFQDEFATVFRNRFAFPRAFVVYQAEQVQTLDEAINRLESADFNPAKTVLIEGDLPIEVTKNLAELDPSILASKAEVIDRTANSLKLSVNTVQPGLLVVSEQYFPGWVAWVDGQSTEIYPANGTMRAVYLDTGNHVVEFLYRPLSFFGGLLISIGTSISAGIWYFACKVLSKRKRAEEIGTKRRA